MEDRDKKWFILPNVSRKEDDLGTTLSRLTQGGYKIGVLVLVQKGAPSEERCYKSLPVQERVRLLQCGSYHQQAGEDICREL